MEKDDGCGVYVVNTKQKIVRRRIIEEEDLWNTFYSHRFCVEAKKKIHFFQPQQKQEVVEKSGKKLMGSWQSCRNILFAKD